jgi:hypothetical protein
MIPMYLSQRPGSPMEERVLNPGRLSRQEMAQALRYYCHIERPAWRWGCARLFPYLRHQYELYMAFGLDQPPAGLSGEQWLAMRIPKTPSSRAEIERLTREELEYYHLALTNPAIAPEVIHATRDLLNLCRQQHLAVVLVIPPEGDVFRSYDPATEANHVKHVAQLANEYGFPLVDARAWVGDDRFADGHHLTEAGAEAYSQRLGQEVLRPLIHQVAKDVAQH